MSEDEEENVVRRILIALDASPHSLAALQAAAEIASHLDAELWGLYVEDINLLRLSELPIAREIRFYSATLNEIDKEHLEINLRAQASRARRALTSTAEHARLRHSFHVRRGDISTELLHAAEEVDMIIMGKAGWSRRRRLGSTTQVVINQAPRHTLILSHGAHLRQPIGVVYDGTPVAQRTLKAAGDLMRGSKGYIIVVIMADDQETARNLQSDVAQWLKERELEGFYRRLVGEDRSALIKLLKTGGFGALVLPAKDESLPAETLEKIIDETDIPVFLVR